MTTKDLRKPHSFSLNDEEHARVMALGGSAYIRACVERDWPRHEAARRAEERHKKQPVAVYETPPQAVHIARVVIKIKPEGVAMTRLARMTLRELRAHYAALGRARPADSVRYLDAQGTEYKVAAITARSLASNELAKREAAKKFKSAKKATTRRKRA